MKKLAAVLEAAIKFLFVLCVFCGFEFMLYLWWLDSGDAFDNPLSSISLGRLVYGITSRLSVITLTYFAARLGFILFSSEW